MVQVQYYTTGQYTNVISTVYLNGPCYWLPYSCPPLTLPKGNVL